MIACDRVTADIKQLLLAKDILSSPDIGIEHSRSAVKTQTKGKATKSVTKQHV